MVFDDGIKGLAWDGLAASASVVSMLSPRWAALEMRICSIAAHRSTVVAWHPCRAASRGKNPVPAPASSTVAGGAGSRRRSPAVHAASSCGRRG